MVAVFCECICIFVCVLVYFVCVCVCVGEVLCCVVFVVLSVAGQVSSDESLRCVYRIVSLSV